MSSLRSIVNDLVEKKLWPVALLLVVAIVALPVALGGGEAEPPARSAAAPPAAQTPAAGVQAVIAVDESIPAARRSRSGRVRNPFRQQHVPKEKSTATPGTTATLPGAPAQSAGSSGGSSGATATPAPGGAPSTGAIEQDTPAKPKPKAKPSKPKLDPHDVYRVNLRFGEAGALRTKRNIARLTPLPSENDPFFVFLGVLSDGRTAVFLVSSDATPTGDGRCRPSKTTCSTIELRAGDTQFFDMTTASGSRQYQMDLVSVRKRKAVSAATAARAHKRVSTAGRRLVKKANRDLARGLRYVSRLGVLVREKARKGRTAQAERKRSSVPRSLTAPGAATPTE